MLSHRSRAPDARPAPATVVVVAALGLAMAALLAACGLDLTGTDGGFDAGTSFDAGPPATGGDATVPTRDSGTGPVGTGADASDLVDANPPTAPDAGPIGPANDAAAPDAAVDAGCTTGLFCGDQCSATSSCNACAEGNIQCATSSPRACTADCASDCPGSPIECYQCGAGATGGVCQPLGSAYCFTTFYTHCPCTVDDPSTCPIETHVCVPVLGGGECRTCGEAQTDKRDCKNGKTCSAKPRGPGPGGNVPPSCN